MTDRTIDATDPAEVERSLTIAETLIKGGVPVFIARPDPARPGDFLPPKQWETSRPTLDVLNRWAPGLALCALGGVVCDFLDVDPRNGGDVEYETWHALGHVPRAYGMAYTPSGGGHQIIGRTHERKLALPNGIDVQAGDDQGQGRGYIYIAPTVRVSKFGPNVGQPVMYRWVEEPDLELLAEYEQDDSLVHLIARMHAKRATSPAAISESLGGGDELFDEPARVFTFGQAREFCLPAVNALKAAKPGDINHRLVTAAKTMSHFVPAFWSAERLHATLEAALKSTEYDGRTWKASTTIDSALRSAAGDWTATLLPERDEPDTDTPPARRMKAELPPAFTDARMADTLADGCLRNRFVRTAAAGWMRWDGRRWEECDDGHVVDAVRLYVLGEHQRVLAELQAKLAAGGDGQSLEKQVAGWASMHSASTLRAVLSLAGNVQGVLRDLADFDADPDLLNTPGGVHNLADGRMLPHDPALCMTRITDARLVVGAEHEAFTMALNAIPDGALPWLQARLGQAITGHMTDDHRMVLVTGDGSNGKTTLMNVLFQALGGYATAVPNELLLANKDRGGAATPEKMTLKGCRLAYVEETPEDSYLNMSTVKQVVGTPTVQGRQLYQASTTFQATHSLFLNTNHPPRVSSTDNGTWRRLVRIDFPYRYRKPHEALERPTDLRGDSGLAARLKSPAAREAALAWLVEGAAMWRAAGSLAAIEDPACVVEATREWRHGADLILRFIDERCSYDERRWIPSTVLYREYSQWALKNGHREIPSNLFIERIKTHTGLGGEVTVSQVRVASYAGLSMPTTQWAVADKLPDRTMAVSGLMWTEQA